MKSKLLCVDERYSSTTSSLNTKHSFSTTNNSMLAAFVRQQLVLQPKGHGAVGPAADEFPHPSVDEEDVIDHLVGEAAIDGAFRALGLAGVIVQLLVKMTTIRGFGEGKRAENADYGRGRHGSVGREFAVGIKSGEWIIFGRGGRSSGRCWRWSEFPLDVILLILFIFLLLQIDEFYLSGFD